MLLQKRLFCINLAPEIRRSDLIFAFEVATEDSEVGKARGCCHIADAHCRVVGYQLADVIKTQIADEIGQRVMRASMSKCGSNATISEVKTIDKHLTSEIGVEVQPLIANDVTKIIKELLIVETVKVQIICRCFEFDSLQFFFLIFHRLHHLLGEHAVLTVDGAVLYQQVDYEAY